MNSLLLPYAIAVAFGLEPSAPTDRVEDTSQIEADIEENSETLEAIEPVTEAVELGIADLADRDPEPQIATGQWTVAVEIKPLLGMTKSNWAAVRLYEGQDLLYFSHLLAFRCGLWGIRWGVNGEPATNEVEMEPCHEDTGTPNALTDPLTYPIYVTLPPESVQSVYVEIIYDDGTTDFARFERNQILIP